MNNNKSKKKSIIKYLVITITALYTPFAIMMCMSSISLALLERDITFIIIGCVLITLTLLPYILLYFAKDKKSMILIYIAIAHELLMMTGVTIFEKKQSEWVSWDKPIIYIYPKEDINVEIKVSDPEKLTVSYPKYNNGWQVKALTDGTLIDQNNKNYYALYWEGQGKDNKIKEDGFIVKGDDAATFLEEKLEILGLNYKERNEFIMYWLPKLEKNKYNYIRFMTKEEIDSNMELIINPKPDTLIRVMMEYKPLTKKLKIKEQNLTPISREGYTVVEWGGTEIRK